MSAPSPEKDEVTTTPPSLRAVVLLLSTIGGTTWRMFGPTIGFTILGVWGDNMLQTKPWLTSLGVIVGAVVAALLVRQQLKKVHK